MAKRNNDHDHALTMARPAMGRPMTDVTTDVDERDDDADELLMGRGGGAAGRTERTVRLFGMCVNRLSASKNCGGGCDGWLMVGGLVGGMKEKREHTQWVNNLVRCESRALCLAFYVSRILFGYRGGGNTLGWFTVGGRLFC